MYGLRVTVQLKFTLGLKVGDLLMQPAAIRLYILAHYSLMIRGIIWWSSSLFLLSFNLSVPGNGLVIYCGTIVTDEGREKKVNIDFEPFKPINTSLYLCDNKFHTEVNFLCVSSCSCAPLRVQEQVSVFDKLNWIGLQYENLLH